MRIDKYLDINQNAYLAVNRTKQQRINKLVRIANRLWNAGEIETMDYLKILRTNNYKLI